MGEGTRKRAQMEPHSGQRRPVWTASSPKTGPKWVCRGWWNYPPCLMAAPTDEKTSRNESLQGLVELSTISNGCTDTPPGAHKTRAGVGPAREVEATPFHSVQGRTRVRRGVAGACRALFAPGVQKGSTLRSHGRFGPIAITSTFKTKWHFRGLGFFKRSPDTSRRCPCPV